jgi:hypothetical protein
VVEGARLESEALEQCGDALKHLLRSRFNDFAPGRCLSMFAPK